MKKIEKIIALLLALAMLASLAACGGGKENTTAAAEETVPEFAYSASYTTVNTPEEVDYLNIVMADENGIYGTASVQVGDETPEGVIPDYEGQYAVYERQMYRVGTDGTMTKLENYAPADIEKPTDDAVVSSYITAMCSDGGAGIVVLENVWCEYSNAPEGTEKYSDAWYADYQYEEHYYLRHLDSTGAEIASAELTGDNGETLYAYAMLVDGSGNVLLACDSAGILAYTLDGQSAYTVPCDGWVDVMVKTPDGDIYAMDYSGDYVLRRVNTETHSLEDGVAIGNWPENFCTGGGDYDFYYTSGITVYGYSVAEQKATRLFTWISVDVNNDYLSKIYVNSDGTITALLSTYDETSDSNTTEIVNLEKKAYDPTQAKTQLILATTYLDSNAKDAVIKFNRTSADCRIDVKEYNSSDELSTDILAGNMPDLLDIGNSGISESTLVSKGLLEDLLPYLENDSELSVDDFLPNVLQAAEIDGQLYSTVSGFSLETLVGASSIVGNKPGWTYQDLYDALEKMPEGAGILDSSMDRYSMLQTCLYLEADNLVDWTTGQCNFDSELFKDILEFSAKFPASFDWDNYSEEDDSSTRVSSGKQMLLSASLYSLDDVFNYDMIFGGDATYIGYPTLSGVGSMLSMQKGFAVSSKCADKDAAWTFVRQCFMKEYQKDQWQFPIRVDLFEEKMAEAMEIQYEQDENNNYILDENGEKIPLNRYYAWIGGEEIDAAALTAEQVQKVRDAIESADRVVDYDESIYNIVVEQAEAYYAGQKSVDDVAKLVQSKANIYVNEQR